MGEKEEQKSKKLHRKKHKNSRLGCPQCKQRRIKCDETLPHCKKCSARSIRCGYLMYTERELERIRLSHTDTEEIQSYLLSFTQNTPPVDNTIGAAQGQGGSSRLQDAYQYPQYDGAGRLIDVIGESYVPVYYPQGVVESSQIQEQQQQQQQQQQYSLQRDHQHAHHFPAGTLESPIGSDELNNVQGQYQRSSESSKDPLSEASHVKHPIQEKMQQYASEYSNKTSPLSFDSPPTPLVSSITPPRGKVRISLEPTYVGGVVEVPLIPHKSTRPEYDPRKFPENFGETAAGVFGRVFLLQEIHSRLCMATINPYVFEAHMLFGTGVCKRDYAELRYHYIKYRGDVISHLSKELDSLDDEKTIPLFVMCSILMASSIYLKDVPMKDHFSMTQGPSAIMISCFQNVDKFPKSYPMLKRSGDGLRFTSRYVYHPAYDHRILYDFLHVVKEFGSKFLENEDIVDSDDEIHTHYSNLVDFLQFCLSFMENEKSNKHVLRFPVNKLYELLQRWYDDVPSAIYVIYSEMKPVEKVVYAFWNALAEVLEEILAGCRYIFTFLFSGFHSLFPMSKDALLHELPQEYKYYVHYTCRIIAFMVRRRQFIMRNTILNDPIPNFFDNEDRFKPRSFDIQEQCIANFKDTLIQHFHYPSKMFVNKPAEPVGNYYRGVGELSARDIALVHGVEHIDDTNDEVDMLDFNTETGLLNKDFDPRYTDPTFNEVIQFQSVDLDFLSKYIEDRKLIIQLDS